MKKAFDRVPRKVMEWSMRQSCLPKMLMKAMMSLYEKAITRTWVESRPSEEFFVKIGVHQGLVLSSLLFAIATEDARLGLMDEILYADDLVLTNKVIKNLQKKSLKWKMAFERKGMKVKIKKTQVMVCGLEGKAPRSRIEPCGVCNRRVMANLVLCSVCEKLIHGRYAKIKKVIPKLAKGFVCKKCRKSSDERVKPIKTMCKQLKTVNEFCYLEDRLNANDGYKAAVTARMRLGWIKFRECGELLLGRRY